MSQDATGYLLLSVPLELLEEAGISQDSIVQMRAGKGQIVVDAVRPDPLYVCDGDCDNCPCYDTRREVCSA